MGDKHARMNSAMLERMPRNSYVTFDIVTRKMKDKSVTQDWDSSEVEKGWRNPSRTQLKEIDGIVEKDIGQVSPNQVPNLANILWLI